MSKRIVLCTDGTWCDSSANTNVYKLFKSLPITASQVAFYDDGVGANPEPIEKLLGGAFGVGLFDKVKQGYTQVAHVYEEGDEIFLFGFSRGAYTARSVAGMIAVCGLPTRNFDQAMVDTAFQAYRQKDVRSALLAELNTKYALFDAKLTMVGVWDTVGSLGIPATFGGVSPLLYGFLDTQLHPDVLNAYQALAIDERRCEFPPTLWTSAPGLMQHVEQVWFCGVHGDVGGGEPADGAGTTALSDIALAWMLSKAASHGLTVDPGMAAQFRLPLDPKYALDTLHNSWNPIWGFPRPRSIADDAHLADSVLVRCQHHDSWTPRNLKLVNGVPAPGYGIVRVMTTAPSAAAAA